MADIEITLGGQRLRLRPLYSALREIEAQTNSSCATLLQLLAKRELHGAEMAIIVYQGLVAAGEAATDPEAVGKRMWEAGLASESIRLPVADYLAELLWAPEPARKKAVGEWFRQSEEITSLIFSSLPMPSDGDRPSSGEPLPENSGPSSRQSTKRPSA